MKTPLIKYCSVKLCAGAGVAQCRCRCELGPGLRQPPADLGPGPSVLPKQQIPSWTFSNVSGPGLEWFNTSSWQQTKLCHMSWSCLQLILIA